MVLNVNYCNKPTMHSHLLSLVARALWRDCVFIVFGKGCYEK